MKKLGLDLGSSSIGWTLREDDKFEKKGVITFDSGMKKGQGGGYTSPTKDRREARSKRRLIQARKYRKWELLKVLLNDFTPLEKSELENWSKYNKGHQQKFPETPNFLKWLKCDFSYINIKTKYNNPYELRVKAISEKPEDKLHKHELGRALYHLVQRRGFKDIGERDTETEKQIQRRGETGFQKALDENRTIAEALNKEFLDNGLRARNQYPYRDEYEKEFILICKTQGYDTTKNNKDEYNDEFIQKLWKAIIWQRPLRSQKGNIGKCTLEPTKPRCPISHPVFEISRTLQFINTIRYYNDKGEKQSLGQKERDLIFEFFLKKEKNFKFEEIKKELNKKLGANTKYNYPIDKKTGKYDTSVAGMPVCKGLIEVFGDNAKNALANIHQYNIDNAPKDAKIIADKYSIYDLWHILFSFDKKTTKDKKFLEKFGFEKLKIKNEKTKSGEEYNPFAKLNSNIIQGYADLSLKAICKTIPFLKEGYLYNEAVVLAKLPELLGVKWEQEKETIKKIAHDANRRYNANKTIVTITNNLIDQYKGLENEAKFAYKDFKYQLNNSDLKAIENSCQSYFGEKSWSEIGEDEKTQILNSINEHYQAFFNDEKRAYRKLPLLTDIFKKLLKEHKIEFKGELYHHSNNENKYGELILDKKTKIEILPEARIDSIKNPMFNKSMSILRKLVNTLIKNNIIDKETEVIVELARELNDNNKRAAIERYQNERKNNRTKYRAFLEEFNRKENRSINVEESLPTFEMWTEQTFEKINDAEGKEVTNKNSIEILKEKDAMKRYELWTEQKGQCMYTGKMISISQLFSNEIDIEHTIPRSILPDNTMANQTVAYAWYNRDKKRNQLPTQCDNYDKEVQGWGTGIEPRLNSWIEKREHYKNLYENKSKPKVNEDEKTKNIRIQDKHYCKMHYDYWSDKVARFRAEEVKDSWARRQLVDTQMVSKYAREFLKTYFNKVSVQKGSTTANFRKIYGFQEEDEIKSRNRHTHHAIDAAVLTLIPANSSHRDRILKEYYTALENHQKITNRKPFENFNSQSLIQDIENNTVIVNYTNDKILQQSFKNVRKRGFLQYLKDKKGNFILNKDGKKILLKTNGDTVRSELYAQTYLGKIKDVERDDFEKEIKIEKLNIYVKVKGFPKKREKNEWVYKQGKEEFVFVKRESIDKIKSSDKLIESIVDPVIKELVRQQKDKSEIKDFQGKTIRHVRIKTSTGKEVKERVNYRSKYDYKNKFYSEAGSIPYAILLQKSNNRKVEREMIPVASFELAKAYKRHGSFVIDEYLKKYDEEHKTSLSSYPDKKLLKVGQKLLVLKEDKEYEKRNDINFQSKRLYVITQFKYDGSKILLQYHLEAQAKSEIDNQVKTLKDSILRKKEEELNIQKIIENSEIKDIKERKTDYQKRLYDFTTRLNLIKVKTNAETANSLKTETEKYKTESSSIEIEGNTPILGLSKNNWNFLKEGEDFEVSLLGEFIIKNS